MTDIILTRIIIISSGYQRLPYLNILKPSGNFTYHQV
jgi:hypothetical protein